MAAKIRVDAVFVKNNLGDSLFDQLVVLQPEQTKKVNS
jgi:hypothetical protein